MRNPRSIIWLAVCLLLLAALVAGCSSNKSSTTTPAPNSPAATSSTSNPTSSVPAQTSQGPGTTATTSAQGSTNSELAGIIAKAAGLQSVKFDTTISGPNFPTTTQKVYWKKSKMRIEGTAMGMTSVIFVDTDKRTAYLYLPSQNTATKVDFGQVPAAVTTAVSSISSNNPVVIGSETLDGKACLVIQYSSNDGTTKEWLWKDNGFPIKIEITGTSGTTTSINSNFDFSDIADSLFDLPAGVQIIDLGGSGLPSGPADQSTEWAADQLPHQSTQWIPDEPA